ncbi:hypothetical protein Btru_022682 [Bulinus truncatus]|nr:hypothetical protein Btru_022682 [Bulinus truncatus]
MTRCPQCLLNQTSHMNFSYAFENFTSDVSGYCEDHFDPQMCFEAIVRSKFLTIQYVHRYFLPVMCTVGCIGNVISIGIFLTRSMRKKSCILYLMVKCFMDTLFLLTLFIVWLDRIGVQWFQIPFICQSVVFLTFLCSFTSVWLVVMVTFENYIRICKPDKVKAVCTLSRARTVMSTMVIFGVLCYQVPIWTMNSEVNNHKYVCFNMNEYYNYTEVMTYVDTALTLVIPLLLNLTWMCGIFRALVVARSRNRRLSVRRQGSHRGCSTPYNHVTAMLLTVTVTFIVLHTPSHTVRLRFLIDDFQNEDLGSYLDTVRLQQFFDLLYYTNFSTNFLIYVVSGRGFRALWRQYLGSCVCRKQPDLAEGRRQHQPEVDANCLPLVDKNGTRDSPVLAPCTTEIQENSTTLVL